MSLSVNSNSNVSVNPVKINDSLVKQENKQTEQNTIKSDSVSVSKNKVISSDNPFDINNDGRKILKPTGESNGKNFYFLYTLERTFDKIAMRTPNKLMVMDDISRLRAKGYTVIVDNKATTDDFKAAFYDQKAVGVVSLGHGGDGALVTVAKDGNPDGDYITHWDIEKEKVSKNLKMVYLQACQAGTEEKSWEKALNTDVIAWEKSVTNLEVMASNAHIAAAGIFPIVGAYFSVSTQLNNKALGKLISQRF